MTTVILTQPHTHAGVHHPIGSALDVDGFIAEWLMRYGIARRALQPEAPQAVDKTADKRVTKPADKPTTTPQE